jgi:hypothetical protein
MGLFDLFLCKEITPEEQKRRQKCSEIQAHINYLNNLKYNKIRSHCFHGGEDFSGNSRMRTEGENCYIRDINSGREFNLYSEIDKYEGWLCWWKNTSIKNIIKEKGHDYNNW